MGRRVRSTPDPAVPVRSVLAAAMLLIVGLCSAGSGGAALVSPEQLPSLVIGPEDLPWEVVLSRTGSGTDRTAWFLGGYSGEAKFEERWHGPLGPQRRGCIVNGAPVCEEFDHCTCLRSTLYSIGIEFAVTASAEEAAAAALHEVKDVAAIIPEVTGDQSVAAFTDRAWYGKTRIIFTRGNVVASVHLSRREGFEPEVLLDLAARLSEKIDAAAAGRPEPPPLLPPSVEEMHVDLEEAWAVYESAKLLSGGKATTLAVQKGNGLARSVSAEAVGEREFIVPLAQLAGVLAAPERVKVAGEEASVKLAGGTLSMTRGKAEARYGGRIVPLSRAVEFRGGQVLVPLSIVEKALGQKVAWEKRGRYLVARLV